MNLWEWVANIGCSLCLIVSHFANIRGLFYLFQSFIFIYFNFYPLEIPKLCSNFVQCITFHFISYQSFRCLNHSCQLFLEYQVGFLSISVPRFFIPPLRFLSLQQFFYPCSFRTINLSVRPSVKYFMRLSEFTAIVPAFSFSIRAFTHLPVQLFHSSVHLCHLGCLPIRSSCHPRPKAGSDQSK